MGFPAEKLQIVPREQTLSLVARASHASYKPDTQSVLKHTFWALLGLEVLLVLADTIFNYNAAINFAPLRRFLNVAREDSLSAYLSSMQTFVVGISLLGLHFMARGRDSSKLEIYGWGLISAFFFYLAIDDGSELHERVGAAVRFMAPQLGFPSYAWQFVYGPLFGGMSLFMFVFLKRYLNSPHAYSLFLAAMNCYVAAVFLDFIEGSSAGYGYNALSQHIGLSSVFVNHYGRVLEEFLEMFGTTLFLLAFMKQLLDGLDRAVFAFKT